MEVLSVPFEKGAETQLLSRCRDYNLKGGFIKGSQCAWLGQGHRLYFISTADNSLVHSCSFASMTAADPDVELTTEVTSVKELMPRKGRKTNQLVVGLNHNNQTGMVCIYDMHISRIVRAIYVPSPVTSVSVIDHGLGGRESRQVLHQVLREMDGILAVGLFSGELLLVDLRRGDYERATPYSSFRDDFNVCQLLPVTPSNCRLGNEERLRRQEGDHLCVFINSMYLREAGMLVDKTPQMGCELITHNVSVSCLQYVSLIVGLVVGYDEGFFQLWDLRNLKLEFSSYARNRRMGNVSHVVFQEPNDDPHPVCYLWITHEDATQHAAILYSLVYSKWEYSAAHGYIYKEFVSALELSACNTALKSDTRARFLDCYCLERVKEGVRSQGQEEADLSLAVFVWEQKRGGSVTTHAHLFDMNEWLKEHRCAEEDRMRRSCVTFTVPAGAVAVAVQPETLRHFAMLQRLDKHLSPNALSFNWLALMQYNVEKGYFEGVQKKLVTELLSRGPTCLVDSELVVRCLKASLQPTIGCDETPQTEVERKMFLLNLMLEYNYSPDVFLGSSENASDFRLLSLLHIWGWERAQVLKDNIDQLSVRLFDLTGVRVDEMWHSELRYCGTQLLTLYMLFIQLDKLAGESLTNIWEHKEGIMLMHVYYIVLQWFVTKGLLPESSDDASAIPYPVVDIKQQYISRRQELAARGQTLFIDQFLERECEEEDLLRLGLVSGVYPPHSVQCLVKMYLLSEIPLCVKNVLTTYVFRDVVEHLDENRRQCAVRELEDFSSKLQFSDSVVHLAEALWLFDHGSLPEGVAVLVDNGVSPADVMPWLHTSIVNMLVTQHQFTSALAFMKWNKMASKNKDDARLFLMVCLAEKSFDTAFQFVREFCQEKNRRDVLYHFFSSCERAGLLRKVMHQPLLDYEEEEFLNYLRRSSSPDSDDMRMLYFTMRGRVAEGLAENDRINRERLHRPRRRRLLCDDMMPLRQLMANIYCKVYPKNWIPENDLKRSLLLPEIGKKDSDANVQENSSASGSLKRPGLSREVRSTLHSVYVSSPGFPHLLAAQSATSTPQGILKVRSYASTRDTSMETLATAASTPNPLDLDRDTATPGKRIQFRISSDSSEKMELDEGVKEQQNNSEMLCESEENAQVATEKDRINNHDIWTRHSTTDEDESDRESLVSSSAQEQAVRDEVEQAINEPSEPGPSTDDSTARSKQPEDGDSTFLRTSALETGFERPSSGTASPWSTTDITRFNRRGIGPRRPLPAACREAASNKFESIVSTKTRTTDSSMLVVEEVELSSAPGKRRLDFDANDSPKQSSKHTQDKRSNTSNVGSEKIITFEVENRVECDNNTNKVDGAVSRLNISEASCIGDVLSIDISDEIFSDNSGKVGVLELDNTLDSVVQSDVTSDTQVEECEQLERGAESGHESFASYTIDKFNPNSASVSLQGSNMDQSSAISETSKSSAEVTFQNKLKKDDLVLCSRNSEAEHLTPVSFSESEHSGALVSSECNISADVSSVGETETTREYNLAAFHTESNSLLSNMGVEDRTGIPEQNVLVPEPVDVNICSKNIGGVSLTAVSEEGKLIQESSEEAQESELTEEAGSANEASEDVVFLFTDVTELQPEESFSECDLLNTLTHYTDFPKENTKVLERINTSEDVDINLSAKRPDVSVSELLRFDTRNAKLLDVKVTDVQQSEPSQNTKIPFGLSLKLLSKETTSRLLCEGTESVTGSGDRGKGHQTECGSLPEICQDVIHSCADQEPTVKACLVQENVAQLIINKEHSECKTEHESTLRIVSQESSVVERQVNDGVPALNVQYAKRGNTFISNDSSTINVQVLPVSFGKEHSNHNFSTEVISGAINNENGNISVNIVNTSFKKSLNDFARNVKGDAEKATCSTDNVKTKMSETPTSTGLTQMEDVPGITLDKDKELKGTEARESSVVIKAKTSETDNNFNSSNAFQIVQGDSQKGHTLVHSVENSKQRNELEKGTNYNTNGKMSLTFTGNLSSVHHTSDVQGCASQEMEVEIMGTTETVQSVCCKNKTATDDSEPVMSEDKLLTTDTSLDKGPSVSDNLPVNCTSVDAVLAVPDAVPSVSDVMPSISNDLPTTGTLVHPVPTVSEDLQTTSTLVDVVSSVSADLPTTGTLENAVLSLADDLQKTRTLVDAVPCVLDDLPTTGTLVHAVPCVSEDLPTTGTRLDTVPRVSDDLPTTGTSVGAVPSVVGALPTTVPSIDAVPSVSKNLLTTSTSIDAVPSVQEDLRTTGTSKDAVPSVSEDLQITGTLVDEMPSVSEDSRTTATSVNAVPSVSDEICVTLSVPKEISDTEFRDPGNERVVTSEIQAICVSHSMKEDTVTDSDISSLSTPGHKEITDTKYEVEQNISSNESQHKAPSKSLEDTALSISCPENKVTESEIPVADTSQLAMCSSSTETSETNRIEIEEISPSKVVQDLHIESVGTSSSLHSVDKSKTAATVSSLELRSRSVERSFDDIIVMESIGVKRKPQSLELHAGMLKKRRSMSVLNLSMEVQEMSTPPRRQRRASLSCSEELRHATPPIRRSLRLSAVASAGETDPSAVGSPSRRLAAHRKRKSQVSKKQLQTVYEDTELTTEEARKKHAEDPYPDTNLSSPFMMPRRFTRSQLRMMKQNVRLEEMRSLGVKSPSASQMSAEDASDDEEDGRPPSVCGSDFSSMVSVSEDQQSEGGRRSPRIGRRSYNLRSRTSNSPVGSEVSHTQSVSSHDDASSVVSGMSEVLRGDLEIDAASKDDAEGKRQSRKTRKSRLSMPLSEELSSPTDSQHSPLHQSERKNKTREARRSQRRPKSSESHEQTSTTSLSDVERSPVMKDVAPSPTVTDVESSPAVKGVEPSPDIKDDEASSSSSDHLVLARQKKGKRRQARQVSGAANPMKKTKLLEEKDASSSRQSHPRQRYSRSAVYGRKSVRVRSSTSSTAKDKVT